MKTGKDILDFLIKEICKSEVKKMGIDKVKPIDKHYDVGVLGVWFGANYGSLLNGYAVYKILNKMGKKVLMIHKIGTTPNDGEIKGTHNARFIDKFYPDEDISPVYSYERLRELNDYCDAFLTGSDQIWHYNINSYFHMSFFMNFVNKDKRKISFGTSFGHAQDFSPIELRNENRKLLQQFHAISVREESGIDLCEKIYGVKAKTVIEPVFCLDKEEYEVFSKASSMNVDDDYILAYILDPSKEKREILQYYAEKSGKKLIIIPDGQPNTYSRNKEAINLPNCMPGIGADDFIKLFMNADFIISDSFHGTAFSVIFNKPFLSIANKKRGYARFEDLLGRFNLMNHLVYDRDLMKLGKNETFMKEFDYTETNDLIQSARVEALDWLDKALNTPIEQLPSIMIDNFKVPEQEKAIIAEKKTVLKIVKEKNCSGCGACEQLCPTKAIHLEANREGFLVPELDMDKCVNCGLCLKKCTSHNPVYKNRSLPDCYAVMAFDEIRKISSSGGMFTIAAQYVLKQGGVVCGAAYRKDFSVEHILVDKEEELVKLRGSKYIQSYASAVFPEIKRRLENWQMVLFTGMPCQVAGLYAYLGKEYNNLYTMDLLCHGITSYKVFEKYHQDVLDGKRLIRLEFKEKEPWGWHAGVNAYFEEGGKYSKPAEIDPYYIAYLNSISKNHTCATCMSNRLPRQGDITMGDFWGIGRHDGDMHDGKGTSVVLINNEKGNYLFEQLQENIYRSKREPLEVAIRGNHIIREPYKLHKNRNSFFEYFDSLKFTKLALGCRQNELYKYLRENLLKYLPVEQHKLYYLAKTAVEHAQGRKIVAWTKNKVFEKILKDFWGYKVEFSIAESEHLIDNKSIFPVSTIKNRSKELYIVAIDSRDFVKNYRILNNYGYKEIDDYICAYPEPIVIENFDLATGRYSDVYGNTIEGYTGKIGKIVFRGGNNHIIIADKVVGIQNLSFDLRENSYIEIKTQSVFNALNRFEALAYGGSTELIIQKNCRFLSSVFRLYNDIHTSSIYIDEKCTFGTNLELHANSGKKIHIGKDCMFSHDIDLWAGDGHSIFDVTTGENINSIYEKLPSYRNEIKIGEHVWVSKGAFILHGANIGNGSIIGAQSVVKGKFPNNCVITGNPAVLTKKDIAWSRDMVTDRPERCGLEYFNKTEIDECVSKNRKVLILGGSGRMSSKLTKLCLSNGDDVTIAVRGKHKLDRELLSVRKMVFDRFDEVAVRHNLKGKYYDVVFDCSGYAPQCVDYVLSSLTTNRYIYVSTFGIYAQYHSGINVCEEDLTVYGMNYKNSVDPKYYGEAKFNSEILIANKYSEVNFAIVRIPFVMSYEDDFEDIFANRLLTYVSSVINGKPINDKNIDRRFNFVESQDEAKFLYFLSNESFKGVINFAAYGDVSMREIIEFVEKQTGKKAILNADAKAFPFTEHSEVTMNLDKCISLGYTPEKLANCLFDIHNGKIQKYINWLTNTEKE